MRARPQTRTILLLALGLSAAPLLAQGKSDPCDSPTLSQSVEILSESASVGAHTTVVYEINIINRSPRRCDSTNLGFQHGKPRQPGFEIFYEPTVVRSAPGTTVRTWASVTATREAEPGDHRIPVKIRGGKKPWLVAQLPFQLEPASDCAVDPFRELFIVDPSVVDDPVRTTFDTEHPHSGAWTFGRLMELAAPEKAKAPALVREFLEFWLSEQHINGFSVAARPVMDGIVLRPWPKREDGQLDLERAPFRLLAIVSRLDLGDVAKGHVGELRFVYGFLNPGGFPTRFTLIFEYRIPAHSERDLRAWALRFHELGQMPFPSEEHNAKLQTITDAVTAVGANPAGVNGSTLANLRTNENVLERLWELRQFQLSKSTGMLVQTTVDRTPDLSFRDDALIASFINQNEAAILAGDYGVPEVFMGRHFRAAASVNMHPHWRAPGINSPEAQRQFAINTCDGCHGDPVTGTDFAHVAPRKLGAPSQLSGFLLGITINDRVTGEPRTFNELGRRKLFQERLVCECTEAEPCSPQPEGRVHRDHGG